MSVARTLVLSVLFLCWPGSLAPVLAQDRAVIERGKAATLLVDNQTTKRLGTAFCVHASGIFVTNSYAVEGLEAGDTLRLVQYSSLDKPKEFEARLVRIDKGSELAILEATKPAEFSVLKLDGTSALIETMTTIAFGYPLDDPALASGDVPAISVKVAKIASLRHDRKGLQLIQLDTPLIPGSAGGPVLNSQGDVIGMVSHAAPNTGANSAIPATKVLELLKEPIVTAYVPYLAPDSAKPIKARVTITSLETQLGELSTELWVRRGTDAPQKFTLSPAEAGQFEGMISVASDAEKPKSLTGSVQFASGRIEGEIANTTFKFQGQSVDLTEIDNIEFSNQGQTASVQFRNGENKSGPLTDRPTISVNVGDQVMRVDLSKAKRLSIRSKPSASNVSYLVIVKSNGKEIYRSAPRTSLSEGDSSAVADTQPKASAAPEKSTAMATAGKADKTNNPDPLAGVAPSIPKFRKLPMPGVITDVNLMGSGTVLAITLGNEQKLVLVDLGKSEIAKVLPLTSSNSLVTGDAKHLFIADAARSTIERYDLGTFRRELAIKLPFEGVLLSMTAGNAANGPLLVRKSTGPDRISLAAFTLLDPGRLKEIKLDYSNNGHISTSEEQLHIRASGNGKVFGLWSSGISPSGLQTVRLIDGTAKLKYEHTSVGHVVPSMDGTYVFTGLSGVMTSELISIGDTSARQVPCLPTSHPRFYLTVPADPGAQVNVGAEPYIGIKPGLYEVGGTAPLLDLPDLKLGRSKIHTGPYNDFTLDKRVFYLLDRNQLVSIPFSNDQVILQEFNLKNELNEANLDYFFITSSPEHYFTPGNVYQYQIEVHTNQPKVAYSLTSGPTNMNISDRGLITWRVPKNIPDEKVQVVVSVTAGDAYQSFDNFTLERKTVRR